MITDRFGRTWPRWRLPLGVVGGALLVSSCLNDRTVGPVGGSATIAVNATVRGQFQVAQRPELVVVVGYYRRNESFFVLRQARLALDTALRAYPLQVDIVPCLRDSLRFERGTPSCTVTVVTELRVGGTVVDQRSSGPYYLVAGRKVRAVPVELFAGVTPPILGLPSPAVLVDSTLIRYVVDAADADGNLIYLLARYTDSLGNFSQLLSYSFGGARASFVGPVYAFPSPVRARSVVPRLDVIVYDTKGAWDTASVPVISPSTSAPRASGVSGTVTASSVTVNFTITDPNASVDVVEIVFRGSAPPSPVAETIGQCTATIPSGDGARSVNCPTFGAASAQAIVIPIDKARNVGFAGRGIVSPPGSR